MEKIKTSLQDGSWLELVMPTLINLGIAIAIFVIGSWIIGRLVGLLSKVMEARKIDVALRLFLTAILRTVLKFVIALVAIEQMGIDTTSLLALLGAAGLAVGMALSGTLQNFAGGVMILLFKPFKVGDVIDAQGYIGTVSSIQIFNTILKTPDNRIVIIPNGALSSSSMVNINQESTRRVDLSFGIGYGDDIDLAKATLNLLAQNDDRVLKDPAPMIVVGELADSSVNFTVRLWVNTSDYWGVYFSMHESVKKEFDAKGISIPFPQQDVHMHQVA